MGARSSTSPVQELSTPCRRGERARLGICRVRDQGPYSPRAGEAGVVRTVAEPAGWAAARKDPRLVHWTQPGWGEPPLRHRRSLSRNRSKVEGWTSRRGPTVQSPAEDPTAAHEVPGAILARVCPRCSHSVRQCYRSPTALPSIFPPLFFRWSDRGARAKRTGRSCSRFLRTCSPAGKPALRVGPGVVVRYQARSRPRVPEGVVIR